MSKCLGHQPIGNLSHATSRLPAPLVLPSLKPPAALPTRPPRINAASTGPPHRLHVQASKAVSWPSLPRRARLLKAAAAAPANEPRAHTTGTSVGQRDHPGCQQRAAIAWSSRSVAQEIAAAVRSRTSGCLIPIQRAVVRELARGGWESTCVYLAANSCDLLIAFGTYEDVRAGNAHAVRYPAEQHCG
jgi:hypothetical protein